ncbi:unnamed protein product [Rotaria sp. Silwood1]|nr:unnamed protein product [Rotaria sp. Silwood1]
MVSHHYKLILDNYLLEIYDTRFRRYIILNEEYFINLQDHLLRTNVNTLNGRIIKRPLPPKNSIRNYLSNDCKRKRTSSFSPQNDYIIIWLDSYIEQSDNYHYIKHKFTILTTLNISQELHRIHSGENDQDDNLEFIPFPFMFTTGAVPFFVPPRGGPPPQAFRPPPSPTGQQQQQR